MIPRSVCLKMKIALAMFSMAYALQVQQPTCPTGWVIFDTDVHMWIPRLGQYCNVRHLKCPNHPELGEQLEAYNCSYRYGWYYGDSWYWVWGSLAVGCLIVGTLLCIWCCMKPSKKQGRVINDENQTLIVNTGGANTNGATGSSAQTVAQLEAQNAVDRADQQKILQRMDTRQQAIDALKSPQQNAQVVEAGQAVTVAGGTTVEVVAGAPVTAAAATGQPQGVPVQPVASSSTVPAVASAQQQQQQQPRRSSYADITIAPPNTGFPVVHKPAAAVPVNTGHHDAFTPTNSDKN